MTDIEDIEDNVVGVVPYMIARPTVYCGQYRTNYVKRWAEYLDNIVYESKWGTQDIRVYAQYSPHSDSYALMAVPIAPKKIVAVSGLRENDYKFDWRGKWFKEGL